MIFLNFFSGALKIRFMIMPACLRIWEEEEELGQGGRVAPGGRVRGRGGDSGGCGGGRGGGGLGGSGGG